MSWEHLLQGADERIVAPWLGGKYVHTRTRVLNIKGKRPRTHGWYEWKLGARHVELAGDAAPAIDMLLDRHVVTGYLVGDRFAPDATKGHFLVAQIATTFERVYLLDESVERFMRISASRMWISGELIFRAAEMPLGPEPDVRAAFYDRKPNIADVKGVTPALEAAFLLETYQRDEAERVRAELEQRRVEEEAKRAAEERHAGLVRQLGDGAGRREMAKLDFLAAARAALAIGGAEFLDYHQGAARNEYVVTYRVDDERLQCVVDETLHVVDAGVCLTDHRTGVKGDTLFTLESLPAVIRQAVREEKLVIWRHV